MLSNDSSFHECTARGALEKTNFLHQREFRFDIFSSSHGRKSFPVEHNFHIKFPQQNFFWCFPLAIARNIGLASDRPLNNFSQYSSSCQLQAHAIFNHSGEGLMFFRECSIGTRRENFRSKLAGLVCFGNGGLSLKLWHRFDRSLVHGTNSAHFNKGVIVNYIFHEARAQFPPSK